MTGRRRTAWRFALSAALAVSLTAVPAERADVLARAPDGCTLAVELRATSCRLLSGEAVEGTLGAPGSAVTYRVDVLAPDATLDLSLTAQGGSTRVTVLDWRGTDLGQGVRADDVPDLQFSTPLPLPGAYSVRVDGDAPPSSPMFRLTATMSYPEQPPRAFWPPALGTGEGVSAGERQIVRTPRGGTPDLGVSESRALGAPPEGYVGDFLLVADVQFEEILGPSALTVRFRYEPEAGGGTGYLLFIDPFEGTATLERFEEGRKRTLVANAPIIAMPEPGEPNRLVLRAVGPEISVTLDGQPVLEATDARYSHGLVVLGAITWSDPVAVTFDHVQITIPAIAPTTTP